MHTKNRGWHKVFWEGPFLTGSHVLARKNPKTHDLKRAMISPIEMVIFWKIQLVHTLCKKQRKPKAETTSKAQPDCGRVSSDQGFLIGRSGCDRSDQGQLRSRIMELSSPT